MTNSTTFVFTSYFISPIKLTYFLKLPKDHLFFKQLIYLHFLVLFSLYFFKTKHIYQLCEALKHTSVIKKKTNKALMFWALCQLYFKTNKYTLKPGIMISQKNMTSEAVFTHGLRKHGSTKQYPRGYL